MGEVRKPLRLEDIPVINYGKFILERMSEYHQKKAIIDGSTGEGYTYDEVISRTQRLAAGLQRLGAREGDVICIFAPNHLDYSVTFYASALINAIFQPLNPLYTINDIHNVLKECKTKYIFTVPALLPKVQESLQGLGQIKVIVFGNVGDYASIDSILAPVGTPVHTPETDWKNATVILLSSSGTTGFPKPAQLSHFALIANELQMIAWGVSVKGDTLVNFLPMFHLYGLLILTSTNHVQGCTIVFMPRFDMVEYLRLIETYRPQTLHVVPPTMVMFAKNPKVSEYDLSSVRKIICGAAPLSAKIEEAVKTKLNLNFIFQGYGMTETGATHFNRDDDFRYKSVGKLMDLIEMKIVEVDTGREVGPNEEGEIWIKGPQVCSGYLNLPEKTKELFQEDGWVKTGDIGKVDEDGFLFIVDRLKELIKYKGYQVAPAVLEDILLHHEAVADVGVIGIPDEEAGELPKAYVVKKEFKDVTGKELQNFVTGLVAPYMKLRGGVEFVSEVPRSPAGKILRKTLREKENVSK